MKKDDVLKLKPKFPRVYLKPHLIFAEDLIPLKILPNKLNIRDSLR